ncbi:MAG: hypothetical protein IKS87_04420 [Lachnospiraceae bacterium]|nr:hypothetical protein [Lachnospiraceae bacterium]
MTSKTLWNKHFWNEVRSRIWLFAGWALLLFIAMPLALLMVIDTYRLNLYLERESFVNDVAYYLETGYGLAGFAAVILGFVTAFFCFAFVYRKSAVDLYHSLPIRREKLFALRYLSGALPVIVLILLNGLLSAGALLIRGCLVRQTLSALAFATVKSLIAFFMAYNIAIIAIMLTGTLIVGMLGSVTLMFFTYILTEILKYYESCCFQTYYYGAVNGERIWHMLLNPAAILALARGEQASALKLVLIFLETIVFALLGVYLYRIRPSESTGKSLCHKISKPIIRFPLVIAAALTGGLMVSFLITSLPEPWYWTTFVLSGLIAHVALELIFEQDVKGILRHPVHLLACLLIAGFVSVTYQYDLFGYDRYLPDAQKVASAGIRLSSVENEVSYFEQDENGEWTYGDVDEILRQDLFMDATPVINLARGGVFALNPERSAIARRQQDMYGNSDMREKEKLFFVVCYHLKSGRDVYRNYQVDADAVWSEVEAVYEAPSYKDAIYQVKELNEAGCIETLTARDWEDNLAFDNTMIDMQTFLNAFAADLADRKLNDFTEYPLLRLSSTDSKSYFDVLCGYYIYPSDTNVLQYLKSAGIDTDSFAFQMDPDAISMIRVYDYAMDQEEPIYETYDYTMDFAVMSDAKAVAYGEGSAAVYVKGEDDAKITRLAKIMIPSGMSYNNSALRPRCNWIDLEVNYTDRSGNERDMYFGLPYGETY